MDDREKAYLKELSDTFKVEAEELLRDISSGFIDLERESDPVKRKDLIETVYRGIHSLKGASRTVNHLDMEAVAQALESVFAGLKNQKIATSPQLFDLLHRSWNQLDKLRETPFSVESPAEFDPGSELLRQLNSALSNKALPVAKIDEKDTLHVFGSSFESPPEKVDLTNETIRISVSKLRSLLLEAEELISVKLSYTQCELETKELLQFLRSWQKGEGKSRVDLHKIEKALQEADHLSQGKGLGKSLFDREQRLEIFQKALEYKMVSLSNFVEHDRRSITRTVDSLLDNIKSVLMVPVSSLFGRFPKLVRDLARTQEKNVGLSLLGGEIEIDRRILEEMKDPFIHLIRNCIDHGIEKEDIRTKSGKPTQGKLSINVFSLDTGKIEIRVEDDGKGLDVQQIKSSAEKSGIFKKEVLETMDEKEILNIVFHSGISTSPIITNVSGRGLGLAIVKEKIEKIGGKVTLSSEPGRGTTFQILLPRTLSTFRGVICRTGENFFFFPAMHVERCVRVKRDDVKSVENQESVVIDGRVLSLVQLKQILEIPSNKKSENSSGIFHVLVLNHADKRIALVVDEILNEQEVIGKNMGKQILQMRHFSGAAILGSGKVVPILNIPDLIQTAIQSGSRSIREPTIPTEEDHPKKKLLVVEDSITARSLLTNMLEAAGYEVVPSVDGIDAFTHLRTEEFDLVVSDVEMPRMNGFDLTAKIRGDKKFADLPVVLVTALESREDREHGIEVGANAYIIKSRFDQSNLLEIIQRLI